MFIKVGFKVEPASVLDLKYMLEMDHLPMDVLSLLDKSIEIRVQEDDYADSYTYLYWRAALAKQPDDGSALVAALRLVWRVHKWTMHHAVKLSGVHIFE